MQNILYWSQIAVAILLIFAILLQHKSVGLSATFGGSGNTYAGKRGVDRLLSVATVVLAIIFFGSALVYLFV